MSQQPTVVPLSAVRAVRFTCLRKDKSAPQKECSTVVELPIEKLNEWDAPKKLICPACNDPLTPTIEPKLIANKDAPPPQTVLSRLQSLLNTRSDGGYAAVRIELVIATHQENESN